MNIIGRAAWGARYARGFRAAPLPARELYLHHSVTAPGNGTPAGDAAAVRTLENIGQSRFGGGISYTFAVAPSGRVYEGHGVDRQGAHTANRNGIARAICLIGNYDVARPPEAMLNAVADLVAHGHRAGWWPNRLTGGHRDAPGASTACPGRHAYALIPEINRRVAQRLAGGTPTPTPTPTPAPAVRRASQEDNEVFIETPEPTAGTPRKQWPRKRFYYGFDPAGGWGGRGIIRINFGPRGGCVHLARWWQRNKDWSPNNRTAMNHWDHPIIASGHEFAIAEDWQIDLRTGASGIEFDLAAPDGVHIFTTYEK